jgi:aminomethyltransferase
MANHRTPLYDEHVALGAKLVDFAGWDMPADYGSQIAEHKAVRESAGMFDVSHMRPVDITGPGARDFLRRALANDIAKVDTPGKALYTCMLNTRGGVVDDLIVYHLGQAHYRAVVNAATTEKDIAWLTSLARDYDIEIARRDDLAIIAVQGPEARETARGVLPEALAEPAMGLKPFAVAVNDDWSVGRTGYTGEDGFELILPAGQAVAVWRKLKAAGATPAGLGARDTLRLEAGLNLYGQDMDEDHTPLESGLAWTVAFAPADRAFVGREALEDLREQGVTEKLAGLVLAGRGVIRAGAVVRLPPAGEQAGDSEEAAPGVVTIGGYAPTLARSIALARVPADWDSAVEVRIRDQWRSARIVSYPFVRKGKVRVEVTSHE